MAQRKEITEAVITVNSDRVYKIQLPMNQVDAVLEADVYAMAQGLANSTRSTMMITWVNGGHTFVNPE